MLDREVIADIAERSTDSIELRDNLLQLGVDHILVGDGLIEKLKNPENTSFQLSETDIVKISDLFKKHMELIYATPGGTFLWYSFKLTAETQSIVFNHMDAQEYPIKFLEEAKLQYEKGNIQIAHKMLKTAINVPMNLINKVNSYILLGINYTQERNYKKAMNSYQKAIEISPDTAQIYNNIGNIYYAQQNYGESIKYYEKATVLDPEYANAFSNMGIAYYVQKKYEKALQKYEIVLKMDPDNKSIQRKVQVLRQLIERGSI